MVLDVKEEKIYRIEEDFYYQVCAYCPRRGIPKCEDSCDEWQKYPAKMFYLIDA